MLSKILRKFQPNFQEYVKKIESQAKKNWFLIKKEKNDLIRKIYRKALVPESLSKDSQDKKD